MASESTAKVVEEKAPSAVPKDRRYVGSKETFAYIKKLYRESRKNKKK